MKREDNHTAGRTYVWDYDVGGNTLFKKEYALCTDVNLGTCLNTKSYTYKAEGWRNRLDSYNGLPCVYDAIEEINSLSMYLNMETFKSSTQQEKEQVVEDAISIAQTVISLGINFVPVVGQYLSAVLTGIDILTTVSGLNQSTAEKNIKDVVACINAYSHYINDLHSFPKPNNVTYTISLLKTDPIYGREIKIESSDGKKGYYTLENAAYDMLVVIATANAHQCSIYKIAPYYTYHYEDFNANV